MAKMAILNCQICNAKASLDINDRHGFRYTCSDPKCPNFDTRYSPTESDAIIDWNSGASSKCCGVKAAVSTNIHTEQRLFNCGFCLEVNRVVNFNYCPNCGRPLI